MFINVLYSVENFMFQVLTVVLSVLLIVALVPKVDTFIYNRTNFKN